MKSTPFYKSNKRIDLRDPMYLTRNTFINSREFNTPYFHVVVLALVQEHLWEYSDTELLDEYHMWNGFPL